MSVWLHSRAVHKHSWYKSQRSSWPRVSSISAFLKLCHCTQSKSWVTAWHAIKLSDFLNKVLFNYRTNCDGNRVQSDAHLFVFAAPRPPLCQRSLLNYVWPNQCDRHLSLQCCSHTGETLLSELGFYLFTELWPEFTLFISLTVWESDVFTSQMMIRCTEMWIL